MRAVEVAEVATEIAASPRQVWEVLTDFPSYPRWTTYICEIDGRAEAGTRLRLVVVPSGRRPVVVRPLVLEATPGERLAWAATMPGAVWLPEVIYGGVHEFVLTGLPDGGTRLSQREHFSGLLAGLAKKSVRGTDERFAAFNNALKHRVEELAGGTAFSEETKS
jgi:hypothetical protein